MGYLTGVACQIPHLSGLSQFNCVTPTGNIYFGRLLLAKMRLVVLGILCCLGAMRLVVVGVSGLFVAKKIK